jgi:hypothetical protein
MKATFKKDFKGIKAGTTANLSGYLYSSLYADGIVEPANMKASKPKESEEPAKQRKTRTVKAK